MSQGVRDLLDSQLASLLRELRALRGFVQDPAQDGRSIASEARLRADLIGAGIRQVAELAETLGIAADPTVR